jgi:hypothetical protein
LHLLINPKYKEHPCPSSSPQTPPKKKKKKQLTLICFPMEAHGRSETCPSEASGISAAASEGPDDHHPLKEGFDKTMMKMKDKVVKGSELAADQPQRVLLDLKLSNDDSTNMELNLFNSINTGFSFLLLCHV